MEKVNILDDEKEHTPKQLNTSKEASQHRVLNLVKKLNVMPVFFLCCVVRISRKF